MVWVPARSSIARDSAVLRAVELKSPKGVAVRGDLLVRNNVAEQRYEGVVDGRVVGRVEYRKFGNRIVARHTVVDVEQRGSGIGSRLVRGVLDDLAG
jgi:L-amino acid N-acyltransferase YncA